MVVKESGVQLPPLEVSFKVLLPPTHIVLVRTVTEGIFEMVPFDSGLTSEAAAETDPETGCELLEGLLLGLLAGGRDETPESEADPGPVDILGSVEDGGVELDVLVATPLLVLFAWVNEGEAVLAARGRSLLASSKRFRSLLSSCLATTGEESNGAQPVKAIPSNCEATDSSWSKYSNSGDGNGIPSAPKG